MGVPVRYVEGYIASDFERAEDYEESGLYVSELTDREAHAWIEVYYDGLGWVPYETTSPYIKSYYGNTITLPQAPGEDNAPVGGGGGASSNHAPDAGTNDTPIGDIIVEPVTEPFPTGKVVMALLIIAGVCALCFFVWRFLRDRAEAALAERRRLITDAINGTVEEDKFAACAQELNYEIFRMFDLGGEAPNLGELPMEYAARLEKDALIGKEIPFTEIMTLIQKQEFGHGVTPSELAKIAEFLDSLWKDVYRTTPKTKRFWYRYVRCAV